MLPDEIRAALPAVAQTYVAFLEAQLALVPEQVTALQSAIAKLKLQNGCGMSRNPIGALLRESWLRGLR